jgi:hypothetical protein
MKTFLISILFTLSIHSAFTQFTEEDFANIKQDLNGAYFKGVTSEYDKHQQIYWINSKSVFNSNISVYFYFGLEKKDGKIHKLPTRVKISYSASSWLFIERVSFAYAIIKKGEDLTNSSAQMEVESPDRDVMSNATIVERIDQRMALSMIELIKNVIAQPRWIECRVTGQSMYSHIIMTKRQVRKKFKYFFDIESKYSN